MEFETIFQAKETAERYRRWWEDAETEKTNLKNNIKELKQTYNKLLELYEVR